MWIERSNAQEDTTWGRWGSGDELGALNLVTPEKRLQALRIPTRGAVYSLAQPLKPHGVPMSPDGGPLHLMAVTGADFAAGAAPRNGFCAAEDYLVIRVHAQTTHLDALGHAWRDSQIYGGFSSNSIRSSGMRHCGIDKVAGLVTRGLLYDLPALTGVEHLAGGHTISPRELEQCGRRQGLEPEPGDAVLIRTGWRRVFDTDPTAYHASRPGIGLEAARWLAERDVALVGADQLSVEVVPYEEGTTAPVHQFLLRDRGIYLLELLDLEQLAADGVHEFCFVAAPLRIHGGTGSPLNPLALA